MSSISDRLSSRRTGFPADALYIENYFALFRYIDKSSVRRTPLKTEGLLLAAAAQGELRVMLNLKEYTVSAGHVLVVLPGQVIQYLDSGPDFDGRFIFMSNEFLTSVSVRRSNFSAFFVIRDNPLVRFSEQDMALLSDYYDFMTRRMQQARTACRLDIARNLVGALFFELLSMDKYLAENPKKINRRDEICSDFLNLLLQHYRENRSVGFYAEKLFITAKYLSATLRAVTGKKASELIDDYVLLQAKVMLKSTNKTIQQISEELNFANQSFFARYFKHLSGQTPTQYRNQ